MSDYQTVREHLFATLDNLDEVADAKQYDSVIKQIEAINKAEAAQKEQEIPEPTGAKAWFEKHSDALIKVGGSFGAIVMIGFVENKFDTIFRSKASKYL